MTDRRPHPGPGSVIAWQLELSGQTYSYAAIHVAGFGWFTTSRLWPNPMLWEQLELILQHAPAVYVASGWHELPLRPDQAELGRQQFQRHVLNEWAPEPPGYSGDAAGNW